MADNGHSVNIVLPSPSNYKWPKDDLSSPAISGGGLPLGDLFIVEALHFHWGAKNNIGSEHTIDKEHFPLEMHIVHRNIKYESFEDALLHPDGLAVLGVLFSVKVSTTSLILNYFS